MVTQSTPKRTKKGRLAVLYLDGTDVGKVLIKSWRSARGYGTFEPNDAFGAYATIFGQWSLLMHADDEAARLSRAAAQELSLAESQMDSMKAQLHISATGDRIDVAQITIADGVVEWAVY